ncbi:hypothetical protein WJX74_000253 [Apatococcus lobatus]|uniref:RING-type domain-containing protein n=1 Tax=Apatococcus lobatus TaxID=904363 RepID=A0AAW1SA44_9CHLO
MASPHQTPYPDASSSLAAADGWSAITDGQTQLPGACSTLHASAPEALAGPARRLRRRLQDPLMTPVPAASQDYMLQDLTPTEVSSSNAQPAMRESMPTLRPPLEQTGQGIPARARSHVTHARQAPMSSRLTDGPWRPASPGFQQPSPSRGAQSRLFTMPSGSRDLLCSHEVSVQMRTDPTDNFGIPEMPVDVREQLDQRVDGPWFDSTPMPSHAQADSSQLRQSFDLNDIHMDHRPGRQAAADAGLSAVQPCARSSRVPSGPAMPTAFGTPAVASSQLTESQFQHTDVFGDHLNQPSSGFSIPSLFQHVPHGSFDHLPAATSSQMSRRAPSNLHEDCPADLLHADDPAFSLRRVGLGSGGRSASRQHGRADQEHHHDGDGRLLGPRGPSDNPFPASGWHSPGNGMQDPHSDVRRLPEYPPPFAMPYHAADPTASVAAERQAQHAHNVSFDTDYPGDALVQHLDLLQARLTPPADSLAPDQQASRSESWRRHTHAPPDLQDPQGSLIASTARRLEAGRVLLGGFQQPSTYDQDPDWLQDLNPPASPFDGNADAAGPPRSVAGPPINAPHAAGPGEWRNLDLHTGRGEGSSGRPMPIWTRPRMLSNVHHSVEVLARDGSEVGDPGSGLQQSISYISALRARLGLPSIGAVMGMRDCDVTARIKSECSMQQALQAAEAHRNAATAASLDVSAGPQEGPDEALDRSEYFVDDICTVCWKEQTEIAYLPCRHLAICSGCQTILGACKPCILCRKAVDEYRYIPATPGQTTSTELEQ